MFKHIHKGITKFNIFERHFKVWFTFLPSFFISGFEQMMLQIREVPAWQGLDTGMKDSTATLAFLETPDES